MIFGLINSLLLFFFVGYILEVGFVNDKFDTAVNFLNCKSVEFSLRTTSVSDKFTSKVNCSTYPDFDTILKAIDSDYTKTIALAKEINALRSNESLNSFNDEEVIKFLTHDIFFNNVSFIALNEFYTKRQNSQEMLDFISVLRIELIHILGINYSIFEEVTETNNDPGLNRDLDFRVDIKNNTNAGTTMNTQLAILIISNLILILIIAYLSFISYKSANNIKKLRTKIREHEIELSNNSSTITNLVQKIKEVQKNYGFLPKLLSDFEKLQISVYENRNELNELISEKKSDSVDSNSNQSIVGNNKRILEFFYLSTPNSEGSFNKSSISSVFKPGASIFKFSRLSETFSEFAIDDNAAAIKMAVMYPNNIVDPVCETINAFNPDSKKIITITPGEAELMGDKWTVTKKAIISYEN